MRNWCGHWPLFIRFPFPPRKGNQIEDDIPVAGRAISSQKAHRRDRD
jgi:hypothetical protein